MEPLPIEIDAMSRPAKPRRWWRWVLVFFVGNFALSAACTGCLALAQETIPASQKAMLGVWQGQGVVLKVWPGNISWEKSGPNWSTKVGGVVTRWDPDAFVVGLWPIEQRFRIDVPPQRQGAELFMTIDGERLRLVSSP